MWYSYVYNRNELQIILEYRKEIEDFLVQVRRTTHPKFELIGIQTHDLQIMAVHFMSLRCLL